MPYAATGTTTVVLVTYLPIDAETLFAAAPSSSWGTLVAVPADVAPPAPSAEPSDKDGTATWVLPVVIALAVVLAAVVTVAVVLVRRRPG